MFDSLKQAFTKKKHAAEQSAGQRYQALVEEGITGTLDEKSVDRVAMVLAECGRTLQDLETDVNRAQEIRKLEAIAAPLEELARECQVLVGQRAALQREHDEAIENFKAAMPAIELKLHQAQAKRQAAARATEELAHRFPGQSSIGEMYLLGDRKKILREWLTNARRKLSEVQHLITLVPKTSKSPENLTEGEQRTVANAERERNELLKTIAGHEAELAVIVAKESKLQGAAA